MGGGCANPITTLSQGHLSDLTLDLKENPEVDNIPFSGIFKAIMKIYL